MALSSDQVDRARGAVLGSAVGDALGAPYEFGCRAVGPAGPEMLGGGLGGFAPGEWTDAKLEYTALAAASCPPQFAISELRRAYEVVWGTQIDPRNFHRKVTKTEGFVQETSDTTVRDGGRPARLYRVGPATTLHPPLLR